MTKPKRLSALVRDLERAADKQVRASRARQALPPGSTRARVTSANARLNAACDGKERAYRAVEDALVRSVGASSAAIDALGVVWANVMAEAERAAAEKERGF